MKTIGIIPARYASTRLPGKPLIKLGGIPMIQRVYQQALKCLSLNEVIVATDDQRIFDYVKSFGGLVMMTSTDHPSGTDRLGELCEKTDGDIYINIQGDEPFLDPSMVDDLVSAMHRYNWELGSLYYKITDQEELFNPNSIKVVLDNSNKALYFSRQTIPYLRQHPKEEWLQNHTFNKHIGIYAYRRDILEKIIKLPQSSLELSESLEQLRWMQNGFSIGLVEAKNQPIGIDTKEDVIRAEAYISKMDNQ